MHSNARWKTLDIFGSQPFQVIGYRATDQRHGMACHILQLVFLCLWHCSVRQGTGFSCFRTLGDFRDSLWLAHNCHPTGLCFETGSLARIMKCYPHPCAPSSKVPLCPSQSEIKTMSVPHILLVLFESPPASWPKIKWHGSVSSFNGTIANAGSVGSIGRYCPAFDMQTMATFTWYRSNRSSNEAYLWSQRTTGLTWFDQVCCCKLQRKNTRASSVKVGSCGGSFGAIPSLLVQPSYPHGMSAKSKSCFFGAGFVSFFFSGGFCFGAVRSFSSRGACKNSYGTTWISWEYRCLLACCGMLSFHFK